MNASEGDSGSLFERLLEEAEAYGGGQTAAAEPTPRAASAPPGESTEHAALRGAFRADDLSSLLGLITPLLSGGGSHGKKTSDRHTALLKALKPYLAPQRRSAVDTLLTLSGLWDSLSGFGIGLPTPAEHQADNAPLSAGTPPETPPQAGGR